ncbi:MAG: hypothetical protein LBI45_00630 [Bacteroidales bacterium]|jgi:hypothetical protein|nr:hypothetical protein [Bacteroidales bacterium]
MSNKDFVYLDFRKKLVYYGKNYNISDCVPATIVEREAFITHFYSKGIKECTFKQLKQYVNFHGTRKQGRIYAIIPITDQYIYLKLVEKHKDFQRAIDDYITESFGRKRDNIIKNKAKFVAKHGLKLFLKTIENEMEKIFDDNTFL